MKNLLSFIFKRLEKKILVQFIISGFLVSIIMIMNLSLPLFQKQLLESASKGKLNKTVFFISVIIGLLNAILSIILSLIANSMSQNFKHKIEYEMLESVPRVPSKRIDSKGAGAYMVNILGDSENLSGYINPSYFIFFFSLVNVLSVLIISLKWTKLLIIMVPILYLLCIIFLTISSQFYKKYFLIAREKVIELNPYLLSYIQNRRSIINNSEPSLFEEDILKKMNIRDSYIKKAFSFSSLSKTFIDIFKSLGLITFICLLSLEINSNKINFSTLVALVSYFAQMFTPLVTIQEIITDNNRFEMIYKRAPLDLIQNISEIEIPSGDGQVLKFNNCSFSYQENNSQIIRISDFTLDISNKLYGIVGISGEGKSTLIKLILGEELPNLGGCYILNSNVSNIPSPLLSSFINIYPQEIEIFNEDLNFNVSLLKKSLSYNEYLDKFNKIKKEFKSLFEKILIKSNSNLLRSDIKQIKEFTKILNIIQSRKINSKYFNEIKNLLNKYKENLDELSVLFALVYMTRNFYIAELYNEIIDEIGIEYLNNRKFGENGKSISGGEKQKIGFARFLLKFKMNKLINENKIINIIDEPFTSLDAISESKCAKIMKDYIKGSPGIIISHKLNLISLLSEEIIVINDARIVDRGSHNDLKNKDGLYQRLYMEFISQRKD